MIASHQWTHTRSKVLLLRSGLVGHDNFQWPQSGPVICPRAKENRKQALKPTCESGGLFGWPWGIGIGEGKNPNYLDTWAVFSAKPEDVVAIGKKAKVVGEANVEYVGPWYKCVAYILAGKQAWIKQAASSGYASSAASSGFQSSAASSGYGSSAASSGFQSSAASSGERSTAASSGNCSSAASSGFQSSAASSGDRSTVASSGDKSTAASSGSYSSAASSGYKSSAASSGFQSSAASSGDYSSAMSSGAYSQACAIGTEVSVKALGANSIAVAIGKTPTVEVAPGSVGVVCADIFIWKVQKNSRVFQVTPKKEYILRATKNLIGKTVRVRYGKIVSIK